MNEELIAKRAKQLLLFDIPVKDWPEGITEEYKVELFEEIKNYFEVKDNINVNDVEEIAMTKHIAQPLGDKSMYNVIAMIKNLHRPSSILMLPIQIVIHNKE